LLHKPALAGVGELYFLLGEEAAAGQADGSKNKRSASERSREGVKHKGVGIWSLSWDLIEAGQAEQHTFDTAVSKMFGQKSFSDAASSAGVNFPGRE
jgi:hypothetical protein